MFVLNSQCPYLLNQLGMVHIIKEAFNIKLYYIMQFCELHQIVGSLNSVLHGAIWSEAVAAITEFGFANWFHNLLDTLLYQPVPYTRDSKRSCFSIRLRDFFPSDWLGPVAMFSCYDRPYLFDNFFRR